MQLFIRKFRNFDFSVNYAGPFRPASNNTNGNFGYIGTLLEHPKDAYARKQTSNMMPHYLKLQ